MDPRRLSLTTDRARLKMMSLLRPRGRVQPLPAHTRARGCGRPILRLGRLEAARRGLISIAGSLCTFGGAAETAFAGASYVASWMTPGTAGTPTTGTVWHNVLAFCLSSA
eukprot:5120229-Prymnesium_polylepis.1